MFLDECAANLVIFLEFLYVKALSHLNKYLWKYKYRLLFGTICIIISNIFNTYQAPVVRMSVNLVTQHSADYNAATTAAAKQAIVDQFDHKLMIYGLTILGMAILSGFFLFLTRQTIIVMSRMIEFDLKNEIYQHYQTLPLSFYRENNTGDLMARISEDVGKVRMYTGPAIMYGLNLITSTILVVSFMVAVDPKLTLYVLFPLPFLSLSIYLVAKQIESKSTALQNSLSRLSTFVQEAFSGIRVMKSFSREKDFINDFTTQSNEYREKSIALSKVNAYFFPLIIGLIGLSTILVVFIGGKEVAANNLDFGHIAEFLIYVTKLSWPVTAVGWVTSIIQRAAASQVRINEFLETKSDIISAKGIEKEVKGDIEFKNINLTYKESGIKAIKDFSVKVEHGKSLGILGHTGSGKSTVANMITRMFDPDSGEIMIDQINLKDYKPEFIRGQIGYVPQDVFLFSDTIRNNIAFGTDTIEEAQIIQAAKDADLYYNVEQFPDKFDTILGERGITLSGGQKQRVSIARALVREPKILILDDCLSAVDTKTENIILNNLKRIMKDRTSVVISHRVSSVKLADQIIVLEDGSIIEKGTHDELIALNGTYKSVYDKQILSEN